MFNETAGNAAGFQMNVLVQNNKEKGPSNCGGPFLQTAIHQNEAETTFL
ncbi:hypothetical protein EMIT07CA2_10015 [Brevibacillus sp. IT-7CA2]